MTSNLFKVAYAQKLLSEFETYFLNRFDRKEIVEWARSGTFNENLLDSVFDTMLREIETEHYSRHSVKKNDSSSKQRESGKTGEEEEEESEEDRKLRLARERLQRRGNRKPRAYRPKNKKGKNKKDQKKDKKKRDWDLMTKDMSKITKKDLDLYDRSSSSSSKSKGETFGCARGEKTELEISLSGTTKPEDRDRSSWSFAGLSDFVKSKTSNLLNKELERSDLNAALETMRQKLVSKNVAVDIAAKLCDSVAARLVGKRLNTFTRVGT